MKKQIILLALACASMAASATNCNFNGAADSSYPACNVFPPKTPTTPASITGTQSQQQAAIAAARAEAEAKAAARAAAQVRDSGNGTAQAAVKDSGNATLIVQGAQPGSGDSFLSVALPAAPPALAPTMVGGAVSSTAFGCGPAQRVVASPVYGTQFGMFSNTEVWLGNTEQTAAYIDENGKPTEYIRIGAHWYGHQVLYSTAVLGVTGATSVGIGGFGSHGGGNAGGGASSGMQRMMTTIQLRLCQIAEPPPAPIVFVPQPAPKPKHRIKRKPACECRRGA